MYSLATQQGYNNYVILITDVAASYSFPECTISSYHLDVYYTLKLATGAYIKMM